MKAAAVASEQQPVDQTAQRMQENVKRMQTQLEGVRKAKDPAQREKLLAEHMQTMRENMALGQTMTQGGGMGMMGGQGGMGMMGGQGGMGMMGGQGGMGMMGGQGGMGMMDQCMKMMGGMSRLPALPTQRAPRSDGKAHGHDADDDGADDRPCRGALG